MIKKLACLCALLLSVVFSNITFAEIQCDALVLTPPHQVVPDRHARGIFWEINKAGLKPSYLMGTMHVSDRAVVDLPVVIDQALNKADSVTLEIEMNVETAMEMSNAMFYTDGTRLDQWLEPELYRSTIILLKKYGIEAPRSHTIKPWAAYLTLSMPPPSGGIPLDMVLMMRGKENGAKIYGLETLKEQISSLDSMTAQDQAQLLNDTVCHFRTVQEDIQEMKKYYLNRDLASLAFMAEKYDISRNDTYEQLMDGLITQRNQRMTERMQPRLMEGNAFIAVGALHLPGEEGILGLLEKLGYTVSPLY